MSGVGSTNAMKKGSGNNPFIAYSEADMQGFLNSAYAGRIVKYVGPSTKKGIQAVLPLDSAKALGDAQNLVADISTSDDTAKGTYGEYTQDVSEWRFYFTVKNVDTGKTYYITRVALDLDDKTLVSTFHLSTIWGWIISEKHFTSGNYTLAYSDIIKVLYCTTGRQNDNYPSNWPLDAGWQADCFNTAGKILLWGYGETVELSCSTVYSSNRGPFTIEPYIVNKLYKVVYAGKGRYYFEEFYYISENVTTGTVEDVAPGKTFYDFTGTKQTGTGTKINPYLATDIATFKSYPVGSFIKWLGPGKTVIDATTGQMLIHGEVYRAVEDGDILQYVILPTLSNPGTAADLAQGKQLIDGEGKVVEGTAGFSSGNYTVKVIDYDGTVLMEKKGNTGDVIDLPTAPTHDKLVFQEWSASVAVSDNKVTISDNNIMVGAVYTTASGQNEFDITLTKATGLSVTLNMVGTKDWGDGTSDTTMSHTYTTYGDYTIKCNGTDIDVSSSKGLFGQKSSLVNYYCTEARFSKIINMHDYALQYCYSLTNVVISKGVTRISSHMFYYCYSLTNIVISNSVTSIDNNAFSYCYSLTSVVIPNSVTRINDNVFTSCYSLKSVVIPNGITKMYYMFAYCYGLTSVVIPNSVTNISNNVFYHCESLTNIVIPNSVTSISSDAFQYCHSITKYDFSKCTAVPSLSGTDTFYDINGICKIIVPDNLYDEWIAASNWSNYADYIYKASEEVTQ